MDKPPFVINVNTPLGKISIMLKKDDNFVFWDISSFIVNESGRIEKLKIRDWISKIVSWLETE